MTALKTLEALKPIVRYFLDFTNLDPLSSGYGLTADNSSNKNRASIAASGFMVCAIIIGETYGWIEKDKADEILYKTTESLLNIKDYNGFFPHFLDRETALRYDKSEYSTIDTMLLIMGLIAVESYSKDEATLKNISTLLDRINYDSFITQYQDKNVFAMSYNDLLDGDYVKKNPGYIYHWHMYAEQLMMYVLYPHENSFELYHNLEILEGSYKDYHYRYSPGNSLFIYHFPLAFLDLKEWVDSKNFSPYENAKQATLAHRQLSVDLKDKYQTFSKHAFGFNASDTQNGYRVFQGLPNFKNEVYTDGTVAMFSVVGSLPYIGESLWESIDYLKKIPGLYGPYGFMDAFNQENGLWISQKIISIDKGLELLSFDAVYEGLIHHLVMNNPRIIKGLKRLQFRKRGTQNGNH